MSLFDSIPGPNTASFDGAEYSPGRDDVRLTGQLLAVWEVMRDGEWHTIPWIKTQTGIALDASVAKHLRNLRLERFGRYPVEKERVTETGLWRYRLGRKGDGVPCSRLAPHQVQALEAADKLLAFLSHSSFCIVKVMPTVGCNCGLDRYRDEYQAARR